MIDLCFLFVVIFFVIFLIIPRFAKKYWFLLVIYTELVLLAQFIWIFPICDPARGSSIAQLIGTVSLDALHMYILMVRSFTNLEIRYALEPALLSFGYSCYDICAVKGIFNICFKGRWR